MTFERSPEGQRNRALFLNVDFTVYVEGGAEESDFDEGFDLAFWRTVIKSVNHDVKLRVIPKGGKLNVLALADEIVARDIKRTLVAMDRDYDELLGRLVEDSRILYTYGYSFENDIFDYEGVKETFFALCPVCEGEVDIDPTIEKYAKSFLLAFRWPHLADLYCVADRQKGLDRERPQKYFLSNAYGAEPEVSSERVRAEVTRMCGAVTVRRGLTSWNKFGLGDAVGHILEVWAYRLLTYCQALYSRSPKLNYHTVKATGIAILGSGLRSPIERPLLDYYRANVTAAIAAGT